MKKITTALIVGFLLITVPIVVAAGDTESQTTSSPPSASFEYSPSTPNPDDTITLDAGGSSDSDGSIVSYEWDTNGDGEYSDSWNDADDGQTTIVEFSSGGTYTVGLRVTDNDGNTDTMTTQITVENPAPTASFEYSPSTPNPDDTITLDASGSSDSDGSIVSYWWDTNGDGEYSDSWNDADDGQTTTVEFGTGGTYTVSLKVEDNGGKTTTVTKQITVENPEPTASFEYSPSTPNPDDTITLDASGSSDPDGSIVSYWWDTNGDGEYSDSWNDADDGQTTTVEFGTGGTYTVSLKVKDNGGKTATTTKQITVENPAPSASFEYSPSTPNPDDTITLDASGSSDPDGSIVSYWWDTNGDGEYSDSWNDADDGETTTVEFGTDGTYTVSLKVEDNGGKTTTVTKQITVENPEPTASFEYSPSTPNPDDTITLDASGSSDPDGSIVSYWWDTNGDGEYSDSWNDADDGQTTTVEFGTGGTYTVSLKVKDNGGKTVTTTKQITVENPAPSASFEYSPSMPTPGDTIMLDASDSNDSDGSIVSYWWDTNGDGEYSDSWNDADDGQTTAVSYDSTGSYTVGLKVEDNGGKTATNSTTIAVSRPPNPSLTASTEHVGKDQPVAFSATGSTDPDGQITGYVWTFDDGTTERGESVEHSFSELGRHEVTLTVIDDTGHRVETSETVTVHPIPTATVTAEPEEPIAGTSIAFEARSDDDIAEYEWDVDNDGKTDYTGLSITHAFENAGDHSVTLTLTSQAGIRNEVTQTVSVEPDASFELTSNRRTIEAGETAIVTFSVTNHIPDRPVNTRLQLDLPSTGASIDSVEGGSVESRSSTNFVTVDGGEQKSLRVRVRFNDPGEYKIGAQSSYYYGDRSNLQQKSIEPMTVTVNEDADQSFDSSPGFGVGGVVVAWLLAIVTRLWRR